jgi:hypothetical protein
VSATLDHRSSWMPTRAMVAVKFHELRRRHGLMISMAVVTIGIPTLYFAIRLIEHAIAPHTYGPAGGYDQFGGAIVGALYVLGFIVAATLGTAAGSADLTEGMFRHLVITGRSRLALYFARIPAALAIAVAMVTTGYAVITLVCVLAAPTQLNFNGTTLPAGMTRAELVTWGEAHPAQVICNFSYGPETRPLFACFGAPDHPNYVKLPAIADSKSPVPFTPTHAQLVANAARIAASNYGDYAKQFLRPPVTLILQAWLWVLLEAALGVVVGIGLASLIGQRTVPVVLMIVLEMLITPLATRAHLPHLVNLQRSIVGVATAHLEPGALPALNSARDVAVSITTTEAWVVVAAWLVGWSALGAWRMARRDA